VRGGAVPAALQIVNTVVLERVTDLLHGGGETNERVHLSCLGGLSMHTHTKRCRSRIHGCLSNMILAQDETYIGVRGGDIR